MPSHSLATTTYSHSMTAIGDRAHQQRFCRSSTDYQLAVPGSLVAARGWRRKVVAWGCASIFAISLPIHASRAEELASLPICSASTSSSGGLQSICSVTARPDGRHEIKINLTAQGGKIFVGGYSVETERYNDSYLAPVVEAMPGDTVAARLVNRLQPRVPSGGHAGHGPGNENPTNLHYFHGGIVTPKNARPPDDAGQGNGDNIFVYLKNGTGADETLFSFEYSVPIPGKWELDARVLEGNGGIEHPSGLNWYHSHLHGRSSDQVMGGLSGLLSVGDVKANVVACRRDPANPRQCLSDSGQFTDDLKARTDVRYALLRDIALKDISALPEAAGDKAATWAPEDKDWKKELGECQVWLTPGGSPEQRPSFRKGYCQRNERKAWLFTVNGQRFPTIAVADGRNLLLRLGNLSPNVAYWLELYNEKDETDKLPLTLLSIDGVVPAKLVDEAAGSQPVAAVPVPNLLFMPASRAEIYVRNDYAHPDQKVYVLRTKGLIAGRDNDESDRWPEIQLARIVLEPSGITSPAEVALNAVVAKARPPAAAATLPAPAAPPQPPPGCVADIDATKGEHRRVTFFDSGTTSSGRETAWSILTEIVQPSPGTSAGNPAFEKDFKADPSKTVGIKQDDGSIRAIPFEEYDLGGGAIDWSNPNKPHVCIHLDLADPLHKGSHKQLWVLVNRTSALHNFHIHQMKFRLATADELRNVHKIRLDNEPSDTCSDSQCKEPDYKLYDDGGAGQETKWHDTIPMPPSKKVYVIMSFDASQQVGRFVFHCHILKHEDNGLMAPIEVWTQP